MVLVCILNQYNNKTQKVNVNKTNPIHPPRLKVKTKQDELTTIIVNAKAFGKIPFQTKNAAKLKPTAGNK